MFFYICLEALESFLSVSWERFLGAFQKLPKHAFLHVFQKIMESWNLVGNWDHKPISSSSRSTIWDPSQGHSLEKRPCYLRNTGKWKNPLSQLIYEYEKKTLPGFEHMNVCRILWRISLCHRGVPISKWTVSYIGFSFFEKSKNGKLLWHVILSHHMPRALGIQSSMWKPKF